MLCILSDKPAISLILLIGVSGYGFIKGNTSYKTTVMLNGYTFDETGHTVNFDDTYTVKLKDESFGEVHIGYIEEVHDYSIEADFKKIGKTEIIIESPSGEQTVILIDVKSDTYKLSEK